MLISVFFMYFSHNLIGIYLLQLIQSLEGNSGHLGTALAIQAIVEVPMLFAFTYIMKNVKVSSLMLIFNVIISAIGLLIGLLANASYKKRIIN